MEVHYALQSCTRNRESITDRFCGGTRGELSQKCITSFFISIEDCIKRNSDLKHFVNIIDDNSSPEHKEFLKYIVRNYNHGNLKVILTESKKTGIAETIDSCWKWLEDEGKQLVYQVQDDYLFDTTAIYETIDIFYQLLHDLDTHSVVSPYNDPYLWTSVYRYKSTPRMIVPGKLRYWIQTYDITCSFLTSKFQFQRHRDLLNKFIELGAYYPRLEPESVNQILSKRGVLGVTPVNSLSLHMQTELEKDPYINWRSIWDGV